MQKHRWRYGLVFGGLALLLLALLAANLLAGSLAIPPAEVWRSLLCRQGDMAAVVWQLRLPRLLGAALLGGALAVSGFLLQTFFANPIASPFVLGISSGAKLAVALAMVVLLGRGRTISSAGMVAAAFAGAMLVIGFVLAVAHGVRQSAALVVSGVMVGYICAALTDFMVAFAEDSNIINLHNWSVGSFSGLSWAELRVIAPLVLLGAVGALLLAKPMGAYQLGEGYAQNVGVNLRVFRAQLILLSGLLSACVAAFAGPVSFVGIAVPHLAKALLGTARPLVVLPACFLGGAAFCLCSDLIARTVFAPSELGISSVTAVLGAPVVLSVMLRRTRGGMHR